MRWALEKEGFDSLSCLHMDVLFVKTLFPAFLFLRWNLFHFISVYSLKNNLSIFSIFFLSISVSWVKISLQVRPFVCSSLVYLATGKRQIEIHSFFFFYKWLFILRVCVKSGKLEWYSTWRPPPPPALSHNLESYIIFCYNSSIWKCIRIL